MAHHPQDGGAQAEKEGLGGTDIQCAELPHRERERLQTQGIQRLLNQGGLPGLGRFTEHHVLALGKQVSQDGDVGAAADKVLAGHVLVIGEVGIHYQILTMPVPMTKPAAINSRARMKMIQ